jgi:hypothetical protein
MSSSIADSNDLAKLAHLIICANLLVRSIYPITKSIASDATVQLAPLLPDALLACMHTSQ